MNRYLNRGRLCEIATLFLREQGIIVQAGNPKEIKSLKDIEAKGATFVKQESGLRDKAGFSISCSKEAKVDAVSIKGYDVEVNSDLQWLQCAYGDLRCRLRNPACGGCVSVSIMWLFICGKNLMGGSETSLL